MRIDAIELYHLAIPCIGDLRPYWSISARFEQLPPAPKNWQTVLVHVRSGDHAGWGEASPGPLPIDTEEWAAGAFLLLREVIAPALVGQDVLDADHSHRFLPGILGNALTRAAVDNAIWDLSARQQGLPLAEWITLGSDFDAIRLRATVRVENSLDDVMAAVNTAHAAGYGEINLKMLPEQYEVLRTVRQVFPSLAFSVDCEGAGRLDQQTDFCRLDDFFLKSLEQPLGVDDLVGHAMLQQQLRTSICLDQTITSRSRWSDVQSLEFCRQIRIEPGRLGGLTQAQFLALDVLSPNNHKVACGLSTRPQTAVGQRTSLALAMQDSMEEGPPALAADYFPGAELFESDAAPALSMERDSESNLVVICPPEPGIGFTPDAAWLKQYVVATAEI